MTNTEQLLFLSSTYGAPLITQMGMGGVGRVISLYINHPYPPSEKEKILSYMDSGHIIFMFMGRSFDDISHDMIYSVSNGSYSDGLFVWSEILTYYVHQYNFRLPRKFLEHMIAKDYIVDEIDAEEVHNKFFGF
ncbi:MAG: hypothetical protein H7095_02910 [Pseudopedobacter sp.]|nr:hypothetical protein [Deinococcales bacterium]